MRELNHFLRFLFNTIHPKKYKNQLQSSNKASCFCIPVSSTFSPGNNNSKNIQPRSVVQKKGPDPSKTPWIAMVAASSSPGVWSLYSRGISSPLPSTWPNGQQENISGTLRYHMQETGTPCPILWSIPPFKVSQSYTSCFPKNGSSQGRNESLPEPCLCW